MVLITQEVAVAENSKNRTETINQWGGTYFGAEVEVYEYPLEINCPKCGRPFYYLNVPEIREFDELQRMDLQPARSNLPKVPEEKSFTCPYDGTSAMQKHHPDDVQPLYDRYTEEELKRYNVDRNEWTYTFHTNKGWQPYRKRPNQG